MTSDSNDLRFSYKYALTSFVATYIAGITHPLDLLKIRFQSHDGKESQNFVPKYKGMISGLRTIYQQQGFRGLFKGFHVSMFSHAIASAAFFWAYQVQKRQYSKKGYDLPTSVLFASIQAGALAVISSQPLWVIRTRMVLNTNNKISQRENFLNGCRQIWRQDGIMGYGKGMGMSLLISLGGILQMQLYQILQRAYTVFKIPESKLSEKHFVCGSLSKALVVLLTYPITTIRTRVQQNQVLEDNTRKYSGVVDVCRKLMKNEGVTGFYKGMYSNLTKGVLQKGIYFYFYQVLKKLAFIESVAPEL